MSAWLPDSVNDALALAPALMLAAPESVTCNVPLDTLSWTRLTSCNAMPPPWSGSATATPLIGVRLSSSTACAPGTLFTGARLAARAAS